MPGERTLLVTEGDRTREVLLIGSVTVGRGPLCEISAADPRLSREHAIIEVAGDAVLVRDLDSRNGTRVNGNPIKEHRLGPNDTVEIGPLVVRLSTRPSIDAPPRRLGNEDVTVLIPPRGAGLATPAAPTAPVATPPVPAPAAPPPAAVAAVEDEDETRLQPRRPAPPADIARATASPASLTSPTTPAAPDEDDEATRLQPRRPAPAAPDASGSAARPAPAATPAARTASVPAAPAPAAGQNTAGQSTVAAAVPDAARAASGREMSFAATALLWVMPLALFALVAGLVPGMLEPDERMPLLDAHYAALATTAAELVHASREPAMPVDAVTTSLRKLAGVVNARVLDADGRVLAPMNEAGTRIAVPALEGSAPRIQAAENGGVGVQVPAATGDGRPVVVTMDIDPSLIRPAPPGSIAGVVALVLSLAVAWLVARKVTQITDTRLSRLGEELELLTIGRLTTGHDPFQLRGGQRIVDAAAFALSPAARRLPGPARPRSAAETAAAAEIPNVLAATLDTDAGFRVVRCDAECEALLGLSVARARGQHLIDAIGDTAVVDEMLRVSSLATPERMAQGEAQPTGRPFLLGIEATRRSGEPALTFRFKRL